MNHVEDILNQENILQNKRLMISGMGSGSGKTVMTCGLMRAFANRGVSVEGYKCGPDYIDPMFHQRVLGIASRNLDIYLQGRDGVAQTLSRQQAELALVEGAMGYYDGLNGTTEASAWALADEQDIPVILVVRPAGSSVTLAAQILGMTHFRRPSHIVGILLTDCRPMLYEHLRPIITRETGLPVLGFLPPMPEADLPSRHLGLVTATEIADLAARFDAIAEAIEAHVDLDVLLALASTVKNTTNREPSYPVIKKCKIAVARDAAFSFYYQDNLDLLEAAGAELVDFSPLEDVALPEVDGLYLGGGYPELHMEELSRNETMRESIRQAIAEGMPTVAECGGFLYLQQAMVEEQSQDNAQTMMDEQGRASARADEHGLTNEQALNEEQGVAWPMAGVLPGTGYRTDHLQRFGYLTLTAEQDSLLLRVGETVAAHEFHYWDCTDCGADLQARKANGWSWRCGYVSETLYAAFPHLYFGGETPMAERFVASAERYHQEK